MIVTRFVIAIITIDKLTEWFLKVVEAFTGWNLVIVPYFMANSNLVNHMDFTEVDHIMADCHNVMKVEMQPSVGLMLANALATIQDLSYKLNDFRT